MFVQLIYTIENGKSCLFSLMYAAAVTANSLQSCLTLCNTIDGSPPGSPVPGILKARTPEWVAISFFIVLYYLNIPLFSYAINGTPLQYSCLENPMDGGAW